MSKATHTPDPQYVISSQKQYILSPLSTATRLIDQEQQEITDERDAFKSFVVRLQSIPPIEGTTKQPPAAGCTRQSTDTGKVSRLRKAYRQTVMDVPHYERMYDESLKEHLTHEFGGKFIGAFKETASTSFTPQYKLSLLQEARNAVERRDEVLKMLEAETQSVTDARDAIEEICSSLQTTVLPEWYTDSFTTQLDTIAAQRQERLRKRDDVDHTEDLSLCGYIYADQPWTYPVLTSVARIRETVAFER